MGKDVLAVFGSASDSNVFEALMLSLREKKISSELRICSAHRTPKELERIVSETSAKIIIAGAGLSAALPGAIASKTTKPVIGIPIENNYSGLDALLSVHQMPPGIPVLGVGVNAAEEAALAAKLALQRHDSIKIIKNFYSEKFEKKFVSLTGLLGELNAKFEIAEKAGKIRENEVAINFVGLDLGEGIALKAGLAINVPLLEKDSAEDAKLLLQKTGKGLWVGLNRLENAGIAAAELLAISDEKILQKLAGQRKAGAEKVVSSDAEQSKKWN
ncbi:MAG: 5-(carboxyamino)imidazole ribonucleotide mutase [Candidatus ainarchaeum sp.]|nr:5-(carboxyamino)imidazole ribonucleotide mutase [Candidatus ainarchaeum sp.]